MTKTGALLETELYRDRHLLFSSLSNAWTHLKDWSLNIR